MKIVIDGPPICQLRMKFTSRGGFGRAYDPRHKEKIVIKQEMADYLDRFYKDLPKFILPRISFVFHMPIPSSTLKWEKHLRNSGLEKHTKKPDVDNLIKLYLDCLDGLAFEGDQKVTLGPSVKLYHPYPKTIIFIQETIATLNFLEVDQKMWLSLFSQSVGKCSYEEMVSLDDFYSPDLLEYVQSDGRTYPRQRNETSDLIPSVHEILERGIPA